ncbi:uncharacterized protein LOC125500034 [Athalia rosae]|uniref:uncharacterized protein LOC125500034 n=1 Tax=Athalia rosae TaxID=37344 RepID=UPI0020340598|nr:uncharacterized protein LOC125500034 [Athalia rosae]XP_048507082.1 uncharacterized protein LOC125500034 [Athalia rosae]
MMKLSAVCLCVIISKSVSVIMEAESEKKSIDVEEPAVHSESFGDALGNCLAQKIGTVECVNRGLLSTLQSLNEHDEMRFDNVYLERVNGQSRDLLDLDYDPTDFGNVLRAGARLMEQRGLKWDLATVYPGLVMQVGPMLNGQGVLEFVIDERSAAASYSERAGLSTGQAIVRNLVLPFLLGFKFNLVSLIPLLFGALLLVSKKVFILAKIAIFLSGIFGWNSLYGGGGGSHGPHHHGGGGYGFGSDYYNHIPSSHNNYKEYTTIPDYNPFQHVIRETLNVYKRDRGPQNLENLENRNFAWARDQ